MPLNGISKKRFLFEHTVHYKNGSTHQTTPHYLYYIPTKPHNL